jgi:hypothetical protein
MQSRNKNSPYLDFRFKEFSELVRQESSNITRLGEAPGTE